MSRSGYTDDCDYEGNWPMICWRSAVKSAIRGKRGYLGGSTCGTIGVANGGPHDKLRAARRPSLKQQALDQLDRLHNANSLMGNKVDSSIIRRALETLPDN